MKSSFEHKKSGKKLEKWTYAQSYPHYPQKSMVYHKKDRIKNRKYVLDNLPKKNFSVKRIDKLNVEKSWKTLKN